MSTPVLIGILIVVLALIVVIAVGLSRKRSKTISFDRGDESEPKQLTQQERSGNYQAQGGFNFSAGQASASPEEKLPVVSASSESAQEAPIETVAPLDLSEEPLAAQETEKPDVHLNESELVDPVSDSELPVAHHAESESDAASAAEAAAEAQERFEQQKEAEEQAKHVEENFVELDEFHEEPVEDTAQDSATHDEDKKEETKLEEGAYEAAAAASVAASGAEKALEEAADAPADSAAETEAVQAEPQDDIAPASGRIGRLRGRLSRSQNVFGKSVLGMLSAGELDEDAWEDIEAQLIQADLGVTITMKVVEDLREMIAERGVASEADARAMLKECLIRACKPELDRSIKAMPYEGKPAVVLVVGVNGTGKTTTTGKLARVLVAMGHSVVLGAADTFRAAAADQLETWGRRVGARTVRGAEGADPASVAFDAVAEGVKAGADVVLVDTAGRLHNSSNLMDQLGKVKRVVEKKAVVDEVLLVLDATTGQNGLTQARTFREVVNITGVVLTKLDGTAKGGIVFQVQEDLGVPVKLVGLGEGADDLAPFEVEGFVDALLG
ncbi:signal recognition particle receptor [Corynebacterium ulcerans]|uniref:Signal recognition particle receptor FtsY n=1 Tax=Corynebacterium ulcerans TaxID=65058 RepID=A0ABD7MQS2_CORUL|nr:signal recognition particle-docking protein FtsY [Corynebacterium ulcerans]SNV05053.1 signal recognition particle receptor [Corynebacterium ulcerans]SQG50251.1 signal recognition particle receptor [Corynebacterium ulcerans]SQH01648.1 signal recognition particle receptor [Corynebacterium ulcerans]